MQQFILDIDHITKTFTKHGNRPNSITNEQYTVLDDLCFKVPQNKITAIIGGNGSGKTTLFNLVSAFTKPESGRIVFNNEHLYDLTTLQPYAVARIGIGRLFQDNHIFENHTVLDNMLIADDNRFGENVFDALFRNRELKRIEAARIDKVKTIFDTLFGNDNEYWEKRNHPAGSLSYGQQRLLGLARLFMADYKLILLDEPTAGVNPKMNDQIAHVIKQMVSYEHSTVFLIEHNMNFVGKVADYCAFINKGKIEHTGTPEQVINNEYVRKTYLGV